jgi:hypothetical protein
LRPIAGGSWTPGLARLIDAHFAAGRDTKLTVRNNAFAGRNSAFNYNQIPLTLTQCNRPLFGGRVLLYYINKRSLG